MGRVDLHIHTMASDGTLTPAEIVQLARQQHLEAIAVTDHDTIEGIQESLEEGKRQSLEVIPGVEVSANAVSGSLHLLGYFVEADRGVLQESLKRLRNARLKRNPRIVKRLRELGIDITYDEVVQISGGGQVGRPHFAQVLVNKGHARSINDAFTRYLGKEAPAYVPKFRFEAGEAIDMILKAGGVPVLAHPFTLDVDPEGLERIVTGLVQAGLRGIEVFYPDHTREQTAIYHRLAKTLRLVKTGGSDFHGSLAEKGRLGFIGNGIYLPYGMVEELLRAKHERIMHPGLPKS